MDHTQKSESVVRSRPERWTLALDLVQTLQLLKEQLLEFGTGQRSQDIRNGLGPAGRPTDHPMSARYNQHLTEPQMDSRLDQMRIQTRVLTSLVGLLERETILQRSGDIVSLALLVTDESRLLVAIDELALQLAAVLSQMVAAQE